MIDLTKPIRRKGGGDYRIEVVEAPYRVTLPNCSTINYSRAELERDFENIPEPRKPREWLTFALEHGGISQMLPFDERGKMIRVIEWPENVPLPDWPE